MLPAVDLTTHVREVAVAHPGRPGPHAALTPTILIAIRSSSTTIAAELVQPLATVIIVIMAQIVLSQSRRILGYKLVHSFGMEY